MSGLISPKVTGKVANGKFDPDDKSIFRKAFYCHEGKRVELTVKRHRDHRTLNQNAYYWKIVVGMIGEAIGEDDPEAVHEMLKVEHNYYMAKVGKREIRVPMSTTELNTVDFEAYLERVRRWASEWLSLYIPMPNEAE
jgi:hypothetical protein